MNSDILPADEFRVYEGRRYVNPNLVPNETNQFIDNLKSIQQANTQQINQQTHSLGTDVPSNLGGLTGANSYFTSRYQTPQTNSTVANLRATAQATALNEALANEKDAWSKRYNDAYRAYQKRQNDKTNAGNTTNGGTKYNNNAEPTDNETSLTAKGGETIVAEVDGNGNPTGWVNKWYADGSHVREYQGLEYSHDVGRAAGADQVSDVFTGMYNYTLDDGRELELGGWDENLMKGNNGAYYIWNKSSNTYTPVTGNSGKTDGGTRWWTK